MPTFLVLGAKQLTYAGSDTYRGTYRSTPCFQENLPADHEVNRAFSQFCKQANECLALSDLNFARTLDRSYRNLTPSQIFDVIEVVEAGRDPMIGGKFLGHDISAYGLGYSLLATGLEIEKYGSGDFQEPLMILLERFFKPQLNEYGLFDHESTAEFCLDCMISLQQLVPHAFESELETFRIVGINLIAQES